MNRISRLTLYVLACILAAAAALSCAGCGMLGIATVDDLNDESAKLQSFSRTEAAARQEATHAAIVQSVRPLDAVFPDLSDSVAATLANAPYKPTPKVEPRPAESVLPWWAEEAAGTLAAAALAYVGVNTSRDRKRRRMGEATNEVEAIQLGQIPAPRTPAT